MTFDRLKHAHVCGPCPSLMLGYWGLNVGFGFVFEVIRRPILRIMVGPWHFVVHFEKAIEKMTSEEVRKRLIEKGINPDEPAERTRLRIARLKAEMEDNK